MDEAHGQTRRSDSLQSTEVISITNGAIGVAPESISPGTSSIWDHARQLIRYALFTVTLAIRLLFVLPARWLLRHSFSASNPVRRRLWPVHRISGVLEILRSRFTQWAPSQTVLSAWSQVTALHHKLDRLTTLLEENIELMSMARDEQEQEKSVSTLKELSSEDEDPTTPPVTASEIYYAAIANNRTLDNLLASFDRKKTSTIGAASHAQVSKIAQASTQPAAQLWTRPGSLPRSLESSGADTEKPLNPDIFSNASDLKLTQITTAPTPRSDAMLEVGIPCVLRHRSPAPSISTTTSLSSPSAASSTAFETPAKMPVTTNESQTELSISSAARCTVCDKGHSDSEQSANCNARRKFADPESPFKTIPQTRRSGIPRRNGRFVDTRHFKSPN